MQAIYFPTYYLNVEKNENFYLKCNHDEYSLWFEIFSKNEFENNNQKCIESIPPIALSLVSRNRLLQINDRNRNDMFYKLLKDVSWL